MNSDDVEIPSAVPASEVEALRDIIANLAGTPIERTGDISLTADGIVYVISQQSGKFVTARVERPKGQEVVAAPYRKRSVTDTAAQGLAAAQASGMGREFTLRELIGTDWDTLSAVEQRNSGKLFRKLLSDKPLGELEEWKTSDNEWHYRRV